MSVLNTDMETIAEFWTEIDQATRRRRIRWAVVTFAAVLSLGGTIFGSAPGGVAELAASLI